MRSQTAALAFAMLIALCSPPTRADGFDFSMLAGGTVPLLSDSGGLVGSAEQEGQTQMSPRAIIDVDAPITSFRYGPALYVNTELGALPGESLEVEKPDSYRSMRLVIGLTQPLTDKVRFGAHAECGFATRLAGDTEPRDKAPRWCGAGLRFKGGGAELIITGNADQRLSSTADLPDPAPASRSPATPTEILPYQATLGVRGRVPLRSIKVGKVMGRVCLYASSVLGFDLSKRHPGLTGGRHDLVDVGIVMGVGKT